MDIKFIYPRWGSADVDWKFFLQNVKVNDYCGVEIDLPFNTIEKSDILLMLKDFKLEFIAQHWQTKDSDFNRHKEKYKRHLYNLAEARPLLINSHTGMDFFSFKQNAELIEMAQKIEEETKVTIAHETHRSRFCYAAHICFKYLEEFPFLKLTSDLSHWCCVAESLLENQKEALQKAIQHTYHIHARVGSSQSPQVIDPRDLTYAEELNQFKKWWLSMIANATSQNRDYISITTEYGPFPYSLYLPNTKESLGNQWEINQFIKNEIKDVLRKL